MTAFRARLRHACRILGGGYPLPAEIEEFCIMTILADIAALKADVAAIKHQVPAADPAGDQPAI
jgi:hypothetical protein